MSLGQFVPFLSINTLPDPLSELLLLGGFRVSLDLSNGVMPGDGHDFMYRTADVSKVGW